MKLGIHVISDRHLDDVVGIAKAAASKGHEVTVFTMADGVRLLENPAFTGLCKTPNVKMSFCDHNATGMGISKDGIPQDVICGSQYNNAIMVNISDRVIVL